MKKNKKDFSTGFYVMVLLVEPVDTMLDFMTHKLNSVIKFTAPMFD